MFTPSKHLVLVNRVYGSQVHGYQADVFTVAALEKGTPVNEVDLLYAHHKSAYVALQPALSLQPDYPTFGTTRPLTSRHFLYQNVYFAYSCSIGSVTGGPVSTLLGPESMSMFHEVQLRAKRAVSILCGSFESGETATFECGCREHPVRDKGCTMSTLGDIVHDFEKFGVQEYHPMISSSRKRKERN